MSSQRKRSVEDDEEVRERECGDSHSAHGDDDGLAASLRFVLGSGYTADRILFRVHRHKSREAEGVCDRLVEQENEGGVEDSLREIEREEERRNHRGNVS